MTLIIFSLFIFTLNVVTTKSIIQNHIHLENKFSDKLQAFSFLEIKTIHEVVLRMDDYILEDFTLDFDSIKVKIYTIDEIVAIEYGLSEPIYARLDYDLVFDSSMDYQIIDELTFQELTKDKISIK